MSAQTRETTHVHTHLLRCALEIEDSRAYWMHASRPCAADAKHAFEQYWFGARSMGRIKVLLANMAIRFDAYPDALAALHRWPHMSPDTRRVICHWHLQLADPLYREFSGRYLVDRRAGPRADVTRDLVVRWMGKHGAERWRMATRIQFASKLLSASYSAGLVSSNRDPRPLAVPRVPEEALEYLMYLLRGVLIDGTLLANPYLASVGLEGGVLEERLRAVAGMTFRRQDDLIDFGWRWPDLRSWADANVATQRDLAGAAR